MLYKFDLDLIKGAKENGLIKILDKNGNELNISSLTADKEGNLLISLSE